MNNNNEQGSAGTPQERAAAPVASGTLGYRSISHRPLCFAAPTLGSVPQAEQAADHDEAVTLLAAVFDAWENGDPCHEDGDPSSAYMGMAFRLDDDVFKRCCDLLNRKSPPRNAAPVAQESEQQSYAEADGCPTERAVLQRFWREHQAAQPTPSKEGEQMSECWSCKRPYTMDQRADADGDCPHCGVEIELDDEDSQPTPSDSASVDTAELNKLAAVFIACVQREQVSAGKVAWQQIITHIESLVTAAAADVRKDAERLDFLDTNQRFRMGWRVGASPVGNLSVQSIIMGGQPIRAAIDAAMPAHSPATSSKEGE